MPPGGPASFHGDPTNALRFIEYFLARRRWGSDFLARQYGSDMGARLGNQEPFTDRSQNSWAPEPESACTILRGLATRAQEDPAPA